MATRKPTRPDDLVESNADTRMIADLLREMPDPAKELGLLEGIADKLRMTDTEFIRIDDAGHLARITVNPDCEELRLVWLLPRGAPRVDLVPVARDATHDAMEVMVLEGDGPEAVEVPMYGNWKFWASFDGEGLEDKGEALCRSWQPMLPGSTVAWRADDACGGCGGFWEIYWPLATADAVLQTTLTPNG